MKSRDSQGVNAEMQEMYQSREYDNSVERSQVLGDSTDYYRDLN